jgi:diguanylate cyclase (GGDEF)-like protein
VSEYQVCVVDDNKDLADVLCEGLQEHGYGTLYASCGEEALAKCAGEQVDLILLDVCMPGMDGYEVCRRLKQDHRFSHIPVMFVTVKGEEDDVRRAFDLGAIDFITKPYNLPMVLLRVDAAVRRARMETPGYDQEPPLVDASYTDGLTGLRNRRYLTERLQDETQKAHRHGYPLACVVFDIDEAVPQDDELGPMPLDDLLAELAVSLRDHTRTTDVLARFDSTVFASVLPHTKMQDAVGYAQKIIDDVNATIFGDPNLPTEVTLNAGVVAYNNGAWRSAEDVLGVAMHNLLQAKSRPKSVVVVRDLDE